MKIYYKTKKEALKVLAERRQFDASLSVFKMVKGTRHHGQYVVCDYLTYLNLY